MKLSVGKEERGLNFTWIEHVLYDSQAFLSGYKARLLALIGYNCHLLVFTKKAYKLYFQGI